MRVMHILRKGAGHLTKIEGGGVWHLNNSKSRRQIIKDALR